MRAIRCGETTFYLERAIAACIIYLNHEYSSAGVRQAPIAVERETIMAHGCGLSSFTRSLVTCFERLSPAPVTEEKSERNLGFARLVTEQDIELLPGLTETLAELFMHHWLIQMTTSNQAEQADKFARSGLALSGRAAQHTRAWRGLHGQCLLVQGGDTLAENSQCTRADYSADRFRSLDLDTPA
jgi:putative hydrolase of the HAD superfamily